MRAVGLAAMAADAGLEEHTFLRRFRKATEFNPTKYLSAPVRRQGARDAGAGRPHDRPGGLERRVRGRGFVPQSLSKGDWTAARLPKALRSDAVDIWRSPTSARA